MRVSQSSQHPFRTRPSAIRHLNLSAPALVSTSLAHPHPDSIPEKRRGREGLIFLFNGAEGNRPFLELSHTKKAAD